MTFDTIVQWCDAIGRTPTSKWAALPPLLQVRRNEQEISAIKRNLTKYSQTAARDSLMGGAAGRTASLETQQRSLLVQGTQALSRGSDSLARTHQIAAETDTIGSPDTKAWFIWYDSWNNIPFKKSSLKINMLFARGSTEIISLCCITMNWIYIYNYWLIIG